MQAYEIPIVLFERFRKKNEQEILEHYGNGIPSRGWLFSGFNDDGVIGHMSALDEGHPVSFLVVFKARTFSEAEKILNGSIERISSRVLQLRCGYYRSVNGSSPGRDTVHASFPFLYNSLDLSYQGRLLPLLEQSLKVAAAANSLFNSRECVKKVYTEEGMIVLPEEK